jgi:hypothetical protein
VARKGGHGDAQAAGSACSWGHPNPSAAKEQMAGEGTGTHDEPREECVCVRWGGVEGTDGQNEEGTEGAGHGEGRREGVEEGGRGEGRREEGGRKEGGREKRTDRLMDRRTEEQSLEEQF